MRKILITLGAALPTLCLLVSLQAAPRTYFFAFFNETGAQTSAQAREIFERILNAAAEQAKVNFRLKGQIVNSREDLNQLIKKKQVHVVFSTSRDFFIEAVRQWKAKPLIRVIYDGKHLMGNCLYIKKDSKYTNVASLKGARALTYDSRDMYYGLRELLKERPEIFFNPLNISPNAISSAYSVNLGTADVALIGDFTITAMKATNPGPLSKLRKLACIQPLIAAPLFNVSPIDPAHEKEILAKIHGVQVIKPTKNPQIAYIHRFLKLYRVRFESANVKDYQGIINFYNNMEKKGYRKDFDSWYRYASRDPALNK